jgi:hypothetical protein
MSHKGIDILKKIGLFLWMIIQTYLSFDMDFEETKFQLWGGRRAN